MGITRALRVTSLVTWVVIGVAVLAKYSKERNLFSDYCVWVWAVGFATGVAASALAWKKRDGRRGIVLALLGVASVSVVFVNRWWPSHLGGLPLVFIAWEAAQILSLRRVGVWIAAQTTAFGLLMVPFPGNHPKHGIALSVWLANTLALAGLQAFAVLAAHLMRRESLARRELARANRDLLATRELAIHGGRAAERLHIARELHDVLGHHLSALSLNLEAAALERPGPPDATGALDTARALTRTTLAEVRAVVSRLRHDDATDLSAALASIAAAIPRPRIHLRVPEELPPLDAERARAILRCAQECVTNAIRHAGAENLWIELAPLDGGLDLRVRDDGRGAEGLAEGNGLAGMRERLVALQGRLSLSPGPPGFEARVWVP